MRKIVLVLLVTAGLQAQTPPSALMTNANVVNLCGRLGELMESGGVAVPELLRAASPLIERTRQTCVQLQLRPGRLEPAFALVNSLKAYLALAEAVPKPFPFPEAAQKQFLEMRESADRLDIHFRALLVNTDRQVLSPDPANLARYAEANRRAGNPAAGKPRVVFFGDSILDFWRLNEYFPESDYLNRGIAGQTSGQLLQRMKADVIDLHPEAVLLLIGTNDLARAIPVAAIEANYQALADLAAANKIKVIFSSVLPVSDHHKAENITFERTPSHPSPYIKALNDWLKDFCSKRGYAFVDSFPELVDESAQFKAELSDDGLHPNAKGYRIMAPLASAGIVKTVTVVAEQVKPKKKGLFGK